MSKELKPCPLCGSDEYKMVRLGSIGDEQYNTAECCSCGFYCNLVLWNDLTRKNQWYKYPENKPVLKKKNEPIDVWLAYKQKSNGEIVYAKGFYLNRMYPNMGDQFCELLAWQYIMPYIENDNPIVG